MPDEQARAAPRTKIEGIGRDELNSLTSDKSDVVIIVVALLQFKFEDT